MDNISDPVFSEFDAAHDLGDQRRLFLACFPENAGTPNETQEFYRWKFHTPIAGLRSREYAGAEDGKILAYYAALPYRYVMSGVERVAAMVCDVMTHPDLRGRGIFTKIGRFSTGMLAEAGFDFSTGYPIRQEVIPGHLKAGWHIVQKLPMYCKLLRSDDLLASRGLPKMFAPPINAALALGGAASRLRSQKPYSFDILDRAAFLSLSDYDAFAAGWRRPLRNALIKDSRFLEWRTGAPQAVYDFVVVRDEKRALVATAIARATELQGVRTMGILDLAVLPEHHRALCALDAGVSEAARSRGAQVVAAMIAPHWARAYRLWRFGYFQTPAVFSVIVKVLNSALRLDQFTSEQDWHLMWIDSDDL